MISNESKSLIIGPTHVPLHRKLILRIVNTSSAIMDQVGTSSNRQFGVRAQVLRTACFLLTKKQLMAQRKLDSFFRPKVPRLEEKVEDDGISGGDGNEEEFNDEFFLHLSWTASNFVPLMFLQGPYFSEEGALGLPKAKSW